MSQVRIIVCFVFSFLIIFSESHSTPLEKDAENNRFDNKKLNLGVIVPLTGPLAFFGNDYVRTYKILADDHPEFEEKINVIWEDSAYNSKQAVSAFNKLVSVNKVDIILSFGGPMLSALAPLAEAKKIPFYATESEKSDCEGRKYCNLFRNEEDEWGQAVWRVLRKYNKKKVGIVKNQNQFMNTFVNAIIRNKGKEEDAQILVDVSPDTTDLRASVISLQNSNVDALGVYFLPGSHHGFLNALRTVNKKFFFFGVEEFLVPENNKGYEEVIDGALVVAPSYEEGFREKFEARFGYSAGFFYTPAFYDFLKLVLDSMKNDPGLRGLKLVEAMRFAGSREGVSGEYKVKQSDSGVYSYSFPISVYKVSANKLGGTSVTIDQKFTF